MRALLLCQYVTLDPNQPAEQKPPTAPLSSKPCTHPHNATHLLLFAMSTRGPSKQHLLAVLLPSCRGSSCCSLAYDLSPGEKMTNPDEAAAAGHLTLVRDWARSGRKCTAKGADLAAARGYEQIVAELEQEGVRTNFKPLMELFLSTKGENWRRKDGWGSDQPVGQWYGVKTNQAGQVTHLQLTANRLRGARRRHCDGEFKGNCNDSGCCVLCTVLGVIPASIGQLAELRVLDLEHNALAGAEISFCCCHCFSLTRIVRMTRPHPRLTRRPEELAGGMPRLQQAGRCVLIARELPTC